MYNETIYFVFTITISCWSNVNVSKLYFLLFQKASERDVKMLILISMTI